MICKCSTSTLKVNGLELYPSAVLCLVNPSHESYPEFGEIKFIIVKNLCSDYNSAHQQLVIEILETICYVGHFNAYSIHRTSSYKDQ